MRGTQADLHLDLTASAGLSLACTGCARAWAARFFARHCLTSVETSSGAHTLRRTFLHSLGQAARLDDAGARCPALSDIRTRPKDIAATRFAAMSTFSLNAGETRSRRDVSVHGTRSWSCCAYEPKLSCIDYAPRLREPPRRFTRCQDYATHRHQEDRGTCPPAVLCRARSCTQQG